jgi:outer membrane immunogenic protein
MKREFMWGLAGASAGFLLAGTAAFAAEPMPMPPPVPVFTWTGFELGAQVGGAWDRTSVTLPPFAASYSSAGPFGGIHLGFNYEFTTPIVVGVQAEYNFAGITGSTSAIPLNYLSTSVRQFGSVDGRLGVAFDRFLVYAIGGFAYGDIRNEINFQGFAPTLVGYPVNRGFGANRYGFDVGGGVEYNFYGNWTARAEYRYYDFGTLGFNDAGFGGLGISIPNHTSKEIMQTGRIGLTYKFAWPTTPVVAKY